MLTRRTISALLAALLCALVSCGGGGGNSADNTAFRVDANGKYVVPPELLDEYAQLEQDSVTAFEQTDTSIQMRRAYVYYDFNHYPGEVVHDRLNVFMFTTSEHAQDGLAASLASELHGVPGDSLYFESLGKVVYPILFGGNVSTDRLFQMALYLIDQEPANIYAVDLSGIVHLE